MFLCPVTFAFCNILQNWTFRFWPFYILWWFTFCNILRNVTFTLWKFYILYCFVLTNHVKGTQDWEFFWLRFWNLPYFFDSYVKILGFYKKNFLIGPLLGEVRFFRVVLGLRRISSIMDPKYDPILVFLKILRMVQYTLCATTFSNITSCDVNVR